MGATVKQYDKQRRIDATNTGQPLPRMEAPTIVTPKPNNEAAPRLTMADGFAVRLADSTPRHVDLVPLVPTTGHARRQLTFAEFMTFLLGAKDDTTNPDSWVVFKDRHDFRAVTSAAARTGEHELVRILDMSQSLPVPAKIAVLTKALKMRFYAPTRTDIDSFTSWSQAFGLTGASVIEAVRELTARVATAGPEFPRVSTLSAVWTGSYHVLASARFSFNGSSGIRSYRSLNRVTAMWAGLEAADSLLTERNLLTGVVNVFEPTQSRDDMRALILTGIVSQPFTMKVGSRINIVSMESGVTLGEGHIEHARVSDSGQDIIVTVRTKRGANALAKRTDLAIREQPYVTRPIPSKVEGWMDPTAQNLPEITKRSVPMDILLAGGPKR